MRSLKDEKAVLAEKLHSEVDNLKSRCTEMKRMLFEDEGQIKLKESALKSSINLFLDKERELQDRIEELDKRLEELTQNAERLSEQETQKVAEVLSLEDESPCQMLTMKSCNGCLLKKKIETSESNTRHIQKLSNKIEHLRKRNKEMEDELKEMQESLNSEFEDTSHGIQDRQRVPDSFSLQGYRRTDYSSSPPTCGDFSSYSRGDYGRWESRSSG
ncbi:hypothetical protein CQW23_06137 [Capsicum baccatum]|uniref:Uncharacterized protein n=1 Tax=Capsicum baccatum TaxID=33114 RepID=A0A2G2X2G6_CAPBA|nr:hypothetical protein CQW23_06137 [Capsicum baccatum]